MSESREFVEQIVGEWGGQIVAEEALPDAHTCVHGRTYQRTRRR